MKRPKKGKARKTRRCIASRRAAKKRADRRRVVRSRAPRSHPKRQQMLCMYEGGKRVPTYEVLEKVDKKLQEVKEAHWVVQQGNHGNTVGFIVGNMGKTEDDAACQSCIELKKTIIQLRDELLEMQRQNISLLEKLAGV